MHILVDFDNVPDGVKNKGTRYIADRVFACLKTMAAAALANESRLDVRFYGGWLSLSSPTPLASHLLAEVQHDFPFVIRAPNPITISGELAQSLLHFQRTFFPTLLSTTREAEYCLPPPDKTWLCPSKLPNDIVHAFSVRNLSYDGLRTHCEQFSAEI